MFSCRLLTVACARSGGGTATGCTLVNIPTCFHLEARVAELPALAGYH